MERVGKDGVLGQNDPFLRKIVTSNPFFKLMFKLASLMPHRRHVIKIFFFFVIIVKATVGKRGFIFVLNLSFLF